ncbi:BTB/POZ domain-containing protein At2g30600 [Telopea speciosissima]|uniref:BTB/POZ domain-containing protein At2g30600 n=1 Tax=Telopea speciosissima TaxID=54955 RepID=UPI001CC55FB4|nr:BTB/POZ domain-containing protein At2g30600 [Telopea speciosissima]XP_043708635.1 BTB/POZ domain-containing protein At2g30600 [Telopea speciosissima]
MGEKKQKFLTVAPFQCAWQKELRFREAGRGCVAFEAFAHNDVTVVFREHVGSQHYHYRRDNSPNYTVVLGSHRNRRLRIEVDGKTVVDVAGVGLCCSSAFQSYWISIYDGLISIGKGQYPFQNLVFQWLDANPNCSIQYVGLSSWDKIVGYRNVNVLPLKQNHIFLWKHRDYDELGGDNDEEQDLEGGCNSLEEWGLKNFLESWELSDMLFLIGKEEKPVPAHKVILSTSGNFHSNSSDDDDVIHLPGVAFSVFHALLQYIYTGQTQVSESQLGSLRDLSLQFKVLPLVKQCEDIIERFKLNKKLFESGKKVEISHPSTRPQRCTVFPSELPINVNKLKHLLSSGEYSDVDIYIDGYGLVAHSHRVILSLWSAPFTKMFTNGMRESSASEICLKDVSPEAFTVMLEFMYSGELDIKDAMDLEGLLRQLLLADQFGVVPLRQECCKTLLVSLSEDSVCSILQAISSVPSFKLIEETCERKFSMHFDYCTTASTDFVLLDEATFRNILQHPDLTVTSEERVLDAILLWCLQAQEICGWEVVDELLKASTLELFFGERLQTINDLLLYVRFPLMPLSLLQKLEKSNLCSQLPVFEQLVMEAINYSKCGIGRSAGDQNVRFQHRRSSFKELLYICDGDKNGVIYFAGTLYGEHQWVNPVLAKTITVTASSPASRYTDPKALVSRSYQGTSFAGPRIEDGQKCAWWMVDIGQDHQLMCNNYTVRQDGSTAYMRYWALQGSLDGKSWTNLKVHENDQAICKPCQFASWPVHGSTALLPFRFFRVILTGPTTGDSNPWNLCICFLELYGYFR